jgi:hypothetical protein
MGQFFTECCLNASAMSALLLGGLHGGDGERAAVGHDGELGVF